MRAIAPVMGLDFALRQVFDFAAQLRRAHQRPCVARKVDREPHNLDQRARGGRKAMTAHQRHAVAGEALRPSYQTVFRKRSI